MKKEFWGFEVSVAKKLMFLPANISKFAVFTFTNVLVCVFSGLGIVSGWVLLVVTREGVRLVLKDPQLLSALVRVSTVFT